ncbi:MAG: 50S ribosomal protein L14e [Thermoprotei archaeon]|nr:50S ribosomal protein L14e [Thermoprotei archaeon]
MPAIEIGRICVKTRGREAGRKAVIVDIVDQNYILITGPKKLTGIKRRRVNINHIEPLETKIEIRRGAPDEEVLEAVKNANLEEFMKQPVKIASTLV